MAISPEELAITRYIDTKNNTVRFPVGTISDQFYQGVYEYIRRTGKTLKAQAPGKFAQEPGLSVLFVPGNLFSEKMNSFENSRFFVCELQPDQTLRDIGALLYKLSHHYADWNFFIQKSNTEEIVLTSEDVTTIIENLLLDPALSEQDILTKIRDSRKKRLNR